jgi:hypothetical protein
MVLHAAVSPTLPTRDSSVRVFKGFIASSPACLIPFQPPVFVIRFVLVANFYRPIVGPVVVASGDFMEYRQGQ